MRALLVVGACLAFVWSCVPATTRDASDHPAERPGPAATGGDTRVSPIDTLPAVPAPVIPSGASPTLPASARRLPPPDTAGLMTLEEALARRRSIRDFEPDALDEATVGQLLWAAQGITDPAGHRTAPSAGGLYPLELYAVAADGILAYLPVGHAVERLSEVDRRPDLRFAALNQDVVGAAPLVIVVTAVVARTAARYGERAERYVALEAGHAAQNVLLQATALGLGAVPIGAFDDATVARVLELPPERLPLYLIAVGRPR